MSIYGIPVGAPASKDKIERADLTLDVQSSLDKADNSLSQEELQDGVTLALAQAKESGEFDGKDGDDGISVTDAVINTANELVLAFSDNTEKNLGVVVGKDGYTPQKNVDYFDGEKGAPFTYEDFTPEQLASLKGDTPQITIGTVETLPAGSEATATITGTTKDPMLNLGIPKGTSGSDAEVPEWAKQPQKPTYTLEELGAQPIGDYALKSETVKTVNNIAPDKNGNVILEIPTVQDIIDSLPMWEGGEY